MYRLAPQVVLILLTVLVLQAVDGAEQDERVSRAIAQLGADQYADRESASRQLALMGVIADVSYTHLTLPTKRIV